MTPSIPWDLFKKYFLKSISDEEKEQLNKWRAQTALNDIIYLEIIEDINIRNVLLAGKWENHEQEWQKLLHRIPTAARQITFNSRKFYLISTVAASILIILGISLSALYFNYNTKQPTRHNDYTYIFSPRGQRTKVVLPDNSMVWLNGESSIRYAMDYNVNRREVILSGEAFFEVEKCPSLPFYVNAGQIKIRVYGTSFNVKAFPEEKTIETTLIEGKLSIIPLNENEVPGKEIFLKPNEKCLIEKHANGLTTGKNLPEDKPTAENETLQKIVKAPQPIITVERNINPDPEKYWKEGILIFRNESYGDLAVKLERWFNVNIHFKDENIRNFRFTGSFEKETIDQAMEALRLSSQKSYQYEIVYRDIYLTAN